MLLPPPPAPLRPPPTLPVATDHAVAGLRAQGNANFIGGDLPQAIQHDTDAISASTNSGRADGDGAPPTSLARLYSNLSASYRGIGKTTEAQDAAEKAVTIALTWHKPRLRCAEVAAEDEEERVKLLERALKALEDARCLNPDADAPQVYRHTRTARTSLRMLSGEAPQASTSGGESISSSSYQLELRRTVPLGVDAASCLDRYVCQILHTAPGQEKPTVAGTLTLWGLTPSLADNFVDECDQCSAAGPLRTLRRRSATSTVLRARAPTPPPLQSTRTGWTSPERTPRTS